MQNPFKNDDILSRFSLSADVKLSTYDGDVIHYLVIYYLIVYSYNEIITAFNVFDAGDNYI